MRAAFVNLAVIKHKRVQTHEDGFVINILIFSFTQVKVNIQSKLQHFFLFGL